MRAVGAHLRIAAAGLLASGGLALLPSAAAAAPTAIAGSGSGLTARTGIAEAPDGSLWVSDEVEGICRLSEHRDHAPVPGPFCGEAHAGPVKAAGLVFDPITRSFYAGDGSSHGGAVWRLPWDTTTGAIEGARPIARIAQDRVTAVALLPATNAAAAPDVLYATKDSTAIMRLSLTGSSTLAAAPRAVGHAPQPGPSSIAPLDGRIYLADGTDVFALDVAGGGPAERIPGLAGGMATTLTVDAGRGRVYAGTANGLDDRVTVLELSTGALTSYERGFAGVTALAVDGDGALLVADDPGVAMGVLDAQGHGRLWRVPLHAVARPSVRVTAAASGVSAATRATFAYSSAAGSTFECRFDGTPWTPCDGVGSGESTYADLPDGRHEFEVRATHPDPMVGTGTPARRVFVVDTRAPRSWIVAPPYDETVHGRPVAVDLLADEPGVDFSCSLDDGPFESCDSRTVLEDLAASEHNLRIRGTDAAGNSSHPDLAGASWAFRTLPTRVALDPVTDRPVPPAPAPVPSPPATEAPRGAAPVVARSATTASLGRPVRLTVAAAGRPGARGSRAMSIRMSFRATERARAIRVSIRSGGREIATRRLAVRPGANDVLVRLTASESRRMRGTTLHVVAALTDRAGRPGPASTHRLRLA